MRATQSVYGLSKRVSKLLLSKGSLLPTQGVLVIIIGFTQILSLGLAKIRQPRVIAEVVGGILLGPTVMGVSAPKIVYNCNPDPPGASSAYPTSLTPYSLKTPYLS